MTSVFAALVSVLILMLIDSVHRSNQGKLQSSLYQEQMCVHFPYPDFSHSSGGRTAEPSCTFWIYFPRISSVLSPNAYNRCTIGACTRGMDTPNSLCLIDQDEDEEDAAMDEWPVYWRATFASLCVFALVSVYLSIGTEQSVLMDDTTQCCTWSMSARTRIIKAGVLVSN